MASYNQNYNIDGLSDFSNEEAITFKKVFSHFLSFARMRCEFIFPNLSQDLELQETCSLIKSNGIECLSELWRLDHNLIFDSQALIEEFLENVESDWRTVCYIYRIFEEFLQQHEDNIKLKKKRIESYLQEKKERIQKNNDLKKNKQDKYSKKNGKNNGNGNDKNDN